MWFDSCLAGLSVWLTYSLQVVFGYLTTRCICAFIHKPRTRVRMWVCFLLLTIAAWLALWIPVHASDLGHLAFRSASLPPTAHLQVALPLNTLWAAYLTKLASTAWRLYFLLLLVSLLPLILKSLQLKSILRRAQPPSPQLQLLFQKLCLQLRIAHCELALLSRLRSPATCYWLRSHVLLPTDLVPQLDSDQLADVLRHELIHVKQHDYLWDRLAALGCRLVFFHPLVWLAYRHLRWERELACDHAVVEEGAEARLRYAECLTSLARWFAMRSNLSAGIGFSSSESLLASRVRALLSEPSSYSAHQKAVRAGLVAIIASVALFMVPSLGLTLYAPVQLATLLTRPGNAHSEAARKKTPRVKSAHASAPKALTLQPSWMPPSPAVPRSDNLVLGLQPASLPVLNSTRTAQNGDETSSTSSSEVNEDARFRTSHPVWDEAPMPLATAPKWRRLVISAIRGGVSIATGVDDVDGSRKKSR